MDLYKYKDSQVNIETGNPSRVDVIEKIEYTDGIKIYLKGIPYPHKSYPTPQVLEAVNTVKRISTEFLKIGRALPKTLIVSYHRMTWQVIRPFILKDDLQTPTSKALGDFIFLFLQQSGFPFELSDEVSDIVSHIFEYDGLYRFRLQDLANETSSDALIRNPYAEVIRLLDIAIEREEPMQEYIRSKLRKLKWLAVVLLIPKYKKAFMTAVEHSDIERMKPDEADRYWMEQRTDYYYFGKKPL